MKLFYLNTLHLTHLARKTYSSTKDIKDPLSVAQQFQKKNIVLLYSGTHIREIVSHSSLFFVERMGQFMDSLPHMWIKDLEERVKDEVSVSWKCFKAGTGNNLTTLNADPPIVKTPIFGNYKNLNLHLSKITLTEILRYAKAIHDGKSQENEAHKAFSLWLKKGEVRKNNQPTRQLNSFRKCLEERIKALIYHSIDSPRSFQQYVNHLFSHRESIKSLWMEVHAEHTPLIQSEIEYCSVAPYAHYFSCNQRIANFIYSFKKWSDIPFIRCTILKNIPEVDNFLAA